LARVAGFVRIHASGGFAALYARAQMPPDMLQVFRATLSAQDRHRVTSTTGQGTLLRILISDVLREGSAQMPATLQALLRRLEAEAAREEARHFASRLVAERGAFSPKSAIEGGLLAVARDAHAPVDA
jgi:hypothetical protein